MPAGYDPNASGVTSSEGFLLDVATLLRWPGNRCEVRIDAPLSDLETSTATVTDVSGTLTAEAMADSLTVSGALNVGWSGDCRRCLEGTDGVATVDVLEVYERNPVEGETFELSDNRVDLEPMVREQALLALPLAPLCADDCAGPAPDAFPATVEGDGSPAPDPRWAALDELVFDED